MEDICNPFGKEAYRHWLARRVVGEAVSQERFIVRGAHVPPRPDFPVPAYKIKEGGEAAVPAVGRGAGGEAAAPVVGRGAGGEAAAPMVGRGEADRGAEAAIPAARTPAPTDIQ